MDPTDLDPRTPRYLPADRKAAFRETEQALEAGRFRRQLDLVGDVAVRNVRQRQTAMQGRLFAEAASLQVQRSVSTAAVARQSAASTTSDVLVSVRDNLIGSLYLTFGRVRTTHNKGPELSIRAPESILRFNVKETRSLAAYQSAVPDFEQRTVAMRDRYIHQTSRQISMKSAQSILHQEWMSEALLKSETPPDWAQAVAGPESVGRVDDLPAGSDTRLFEIYKMGANRKPKLHLSRGMAARLTVTKQTMDAIAVAVDLAAKAGRSAERNRVFYDYLREHAPEFALMIREP